ncbi:MAG: riboflavin synthase [Deltaproteobacteria bacterium]|jgi:riboflavin synthase|nr:riboflavin synthase [Deltaproteobacteria bacterium]
MFTGLALGRGQIAAQVAAPGGAALTIQPGFAWLDPLSLGESVAVSGVCLTVEKILGEPTGPASFVAFASLETLTRSTLGSPQKQVNLERALKLNDRLGGHLVSGHVDGRGRVQSLRSNGLGQELTVAFAQELGPQIVPKGSIAVDGISLTVNEVLTAHFTVQLIPATLERTTLINLTPGQAVNLETDLLAKYVQKLLNGSKTEGLTLETLAKNGFL